MAAENTSSIQSLSTETGEVDPDRRSAQCGALHSRWLFTRRLARRRSNAIRDAVQPDLRRDQTAAFHSSRNAVAYGRPDRFNRISTGNLWPARPFRGIILAMQILMVILIVVSAVAVVIGATQLTQATAGVGAIAIGCFVAIMARLAQAAALGSQRPHDAAAAAAGPEPQIARYLRAPAQGDWPPSPGERIRVTNALELVAEASRTAPRAAVLSPGTQFMVVRSQSGWLYVQATDGTAEGWLQTL
jgi:hypothetical protein